METKGKGRDTGGSNTRTILPIEKHSEEATKNDETDNAIVCRRRKHSMLDQVSDDDDFEDERRTATKSDGIEKDKACRRRKHSMLDQINDDDDFEDEPLLPTERDRKGHGRQKRRSRTHCIPDNHTSNVKNQLAQNLAEPPTDTLNSSWLNEDMDDNPWLHLFSTREQQQARINKKKEKRPQITKLKRKERRMKRKKQQQSVSDRQHNTEDKDEETNTQDNKLPQNTAPYTPLTVFNTRFAISKMPLHSPKLPNHMITLRAYPMHLRSLARKKPDRC
jgi:hypothetical protein